MMRLVCLFFLCVLLLLVPSSFSEISVEEFEKIRTIVKEEVSASEGRLRAEIAASEKRLRVEIAAAEKRAMEHTSQEIAKLTVRMDATDKHRAAQFEAVDNRFDDTNHRFGDVNMRLNLNFTLLVVLIGVVIGLPLFRDRKKEREQDAKLEAQQKQLEAQQQRIEAQERELAAVRAELAALKQQPTLHVEQPQT